MQKVYKQNIQLKNNIMKEQNRKSPIWRKQRPLRIMLWIGMAVSCFVLFRLFLGEFKIAGAAFFSLTINTIIWGSILFGCYIYSYRKNVIAIMKGKERLELDEESITSSYKPYARNFEHAYESTKIYYRDISRMEYYPYYQALKIYAPVHFTIYYDCIYMLPEKQGIMNSPGEFRVYYEYFDDFGDCMRVLEQRTGMAIEVIDGAVEFKMERRPA